MSIESTLEQVSAIRQALSDPAMLIGSRSALTGGTEAPVAGEAPGGEAAPAPVAAAAAQANAPPSFAAALAQASAGYAGTSAAAVPQFGYPQASGTAGMDGSVGVLGLAGTSLGGSAEGSGARIVAIAESQLGQTEQPPGSNESPAIAQYRTATEGAAPGAPWCAYFASWVARQAGEPLGARGQGLGDVSGIWSWAQSTGRAIPNGPGVVPKPGDLIVFGDEHVGIVRDVLPSGQIQTIEGNYENKVAANVRSPTEASGYVEMS
jgi:CHAP domain